jgi:replication-associated recombination protein RarA
MQTDLLFPQSLAEKYRPVRIADFIGLERPKKILSAFCKRPASGAWLFVGPSGVGKSTMALAIAAELAAELHKIPSQKCNAQSIEDTVRQCWYAPMTPGGFHVVLADEADQMTSAAQLALLSKLDSTDAAPNTIWIFTANDTERFGAPIPVPLQSIGVFQLWSGRGDSHLSRQGVARRRRKRQRTRLGTIGER